MASRQPKARPVLKHPDLLIAAEPSATEYSLRVFLRTPHPTMPNFVLNTDDIEDLASYIASLKTRQ